MKRDTWKTIWQMGWKITLGCAIFALGFDLFLEPNDLNVGGMSGLAMVARKLLGLGSIGVLANHAAMVCALADGRVRCTYENGGASEIDIGAGIAEVADNQVTLLVSDAKLKQ